MSEYKKAGAEGGRRAPPGRGAAAGSSGARGSSGAQQQQVFKQVDCSDLLVEEDIQRSKLQGALAIADELRDVQETFDEFGRLIQHQQPGLNAIERNVNNSVGAVQRGTEHLRKA